MTARVLLVGHSGDLAAAARMVALARALAARGARPVVAGEATWLTSSLLCDRGELDIVPLRDPPVAIDARPADGDAAAAFAGALHEDLALLADVEPAAVVTDGRPSAIVAAELGRVRCLSLAPASALGPLAGPPPTAEEYAAAIAAAYGMPLDLVTDARPELTGRAPGAAMTPAPRAVPPGLAELLARVGAAPRRWLHDLALAPRTAALVDATRWTLVATPGLEAVGELFVEPSPGTPWWWPELAGDAPIVVADVADAGEPAWGAALVDRVARLRGHVTIAAVGDGWAPAGVRAARRLPGVPRGTRCVVTTRASRIAPAVAAGVPVVLVPATVDDAFTALPWIRAGAVVMAPRDAASPGDERLGVAVARTAGADVANIARGLAPAAALARVVELAAP